MNNDITEDYCSFELSKVLKAKRFDAACNHKCCFTDRGEFYRGQLLEYTKLTDSDRQYKDGNTLCPTHSLAIKWIRENLNKVINVYANASGYLFEIHDTAKLGGSHKYDSAYSGPNESGVWDKFEEATEAALLYTLENFTLNP